MYITTFKSIKLNSILLRTLWPTEFLWIRRFILLFIYCYACFEWWWWWKFMALAFLSVDWHTLKWEQHIAAANVLDACSHAKDKFLIPLWFYMYTRLFIWLIHRNQMYDCIVQNTDYYETSIAFVKLTIMKHPWNWPIVSINSRLANSNARTQNLNNSRIKLFGNLNSIFNCN